MTGSIIAVFVACAAASATPFTPPKRGTLVRCCFHGDKTPSLSLRESVGTFNCFGCGAKGGLLHAVVAFGLAADLSEASHWLAERRLIAPSDGSKASRERTPFVAPATYTNYAALDDESRYFRTAALLDALDMIGPIALRAARDHIAVMRKQRDDARARRFESVLQSFRDDTARQESVYHA